MNQPQTDRLQRRQNVGESRTHLLIKVANHTEAWVEQLIEMCDKKTEHCKCTHKKKRYFHEVIKCQ
jgi:hypothetical protein